MLCVHVHVHVCVHVFVILVCILVEISTVRSPGCYMYLVERPEMVIIFLVAKHFSDALRHGWVIHRKCQCRNKLNCNEFMSS